MPQNNSTSRPPASPTYRLHKATGQAVVTLAGQDFYLGKHSSQRSLAEYHRLVAEFHGRGGLRPPKRRNKAPSPGRAQSLREIADGYLEHLRERKSSAWQSHNFERYRAAYQGAFGSGRHDQNEGKKNTVLQREYGQMQIADFSVLTLQNIQLELVKASKMVRSTINQRIYLIRALILWAVSMELAPADLATRLKEFQMLRAGDFGVKEGRVVEPVAEEHVWAVLPHVSKVIAAMIGVHYWSGMRPADVLRMKPRELNRKPAGVDLTKPHAWEYIPEEHKNKGKGKAYLIVLGPKAKEFLRPFLDCVPPPSPQDPVFSPLKSEAERALARRESCERDEHGIFKLTPSRQERKRTIGMRRCGKQLRNHYGFAEYRRAIDRGIQAANAVFKRKAIFKALERVLGEAVARNFRDHIERIPVELKTKQLDRKIRFGIKDAMEEGVTMPLQIEHLVSIAKTARDETQDAVPRWCPRQLRHSAASRIRRELGTIESARTALGHGSVKTTEIYAERDRISVLKTMAEHG